MCMICIWELKNWLAFAGAWARFGRKVGEPDIFRGFTFRDRSAPYYARRDITVASMVLRASFTTNRLESKRAKGLQGCVVAFDIKLDMRLYSFHPRRSPLSRKYMHHTKTAKITIAQMNHIILVLGGHCSIRALTLKFGERASK